MPLTWTDRALAVTPGGCQTRSKRATSFPFVPPVLVGGAGARVYDTDGQWYIDWICGLGAISLGYANEYVDRAVEAQLTKGVSFSLATSVEVEAAEALTAALGCEQVRFCKTGSEATAGAIRMARLATGRDHVISIGYHGWHSEHDAAAKSHPGVPWGYAQHVQGWPYGQELPNFREPVACVLLEACRDEAPPAGYLEHVRRWCTERGVVLVFDEMVTGFRWALRGAAEFFGIQPDLQCFGKGVANGFPLALIAGPRHLMSHAAYVSGTFGGEALSLAAALATLDVYQRRPVIKHMWAIGERFMTGFNGLPAELRGDLRMAGYTVHPRFTGSRRDEFLRSALTEGLLFHPAGFNVSLAHDDIVVEETLIACRKALERIA